MNFRVVLAATGIVLMIVGLSMLLPLMWAVYFRGPDVQAFQISFIITFITGFLMFYFNRTKGDIRHKEGFAIVTFTWTFATLFGSLPYILSGSLPTLADVIFETMSGFTATGATIVTDIEALPMGILFWRNLTQWLGGMGIIVLFVAIQSSIGTGGVQIFKAEAAGPVADKIKPRISETAKILWHTYLVLTLLVILALWLVGMPLFEAICHGFSTIATGGFSPKNQSIAHYDNPLIHWIIIVFMFLSGINFALHYAAIRKRDIRYFWRNEEVRLYTMLILGATFFVTFDILIEAGGNFFDTLTLATFQVVSIITTTGYITSDYQQWPVFAEGIIFALMFVGGCFGSTSGSMKVGRILILLKQAHIEFKRIIHPRMITQLKLKGKVVPEEIVINMTQFFFIFMLLFMVSTIIMAGLGLPLTDAIFAVAGTITNVGPSFGLVGPLDNYAQIPYAGKFMLSFLMLLGRLELYTVLVILTPHFWKK